MTRLLLAAAAALLVLGTAAESAWAAPVAAPKLVAVRPTAMFVIKPDTDLRMIRASMPALLHPAIHDPSTGEAARASFEKAVVKTMADNGGEALIAVRREDQVALLPARQRGSRQPFVGGAAALLSLDELDQPRFKTVGPGELLMVQHRLAKGDVGSAAELLRELFDRRR